MSSRGRALVADLATQHRVGLRRLERAFAREVGIGPKAFLRVVRFNSLLEQSRLERESDWAALAWDCGFADQPHLIREFRDLSGASPKNIGHETFDLARLFVTPARLAAYFGRVSHSFNPPDVPVR